MKIRESGENYLETIYVLKLSKSEVRAIDVAQELNYSKPSVSRAIGILKKEDLIVVDNSSGNISFTLKGRAMAEMIYKRHGIIKDFLQSVLGVSEATADNDACKIEHVISSETIQKMIDYNKK